MADHEPKYFTQVAYDEHDNSSSPYTKRVQLFGWDSDGLQKVRLAANPTSGALQVEVVSGGSAGTQYTEGDVDTTITGTAMMMEGAGNTLYPAQGDSTDGLLVNLGANNDVAISGSVAVTGTFWQATQPVSIASAIAVTDNAGSLTVDNGTLSVVGGGVEASALRVTIASDSTGVLSIDDNGGSLTVDGTVAVSSVIAGTGSTNIGKAEDAAHASGHVGVMALTVRNDNAATSFSGSNSDYTPIAADARGVLFVEESPKATPALTNVSASATSVTVLASNAARRGATIYNDSTEILYLKFGATASATSFTIKMQPDTYYEVPFVYTGVIDGIWNSASGSARVTELTV